MESSTSAVAFSTIETMFLKDNADVLMGIMEKKIMECSGNNQKNDVSN